MHRTMTGVSLALATALLVAACSSSSTAGTSAGSPATQKVAGTSATPTAAPASSAPAAAAAAVNVCNLLSAAAVSSLTGNKYVSATENTLGPGVDACDYSITGPYDLSVNVYEPSSSMTMDEMVLQIGGASTATSVSGVGDKAFVSPIGVVAQFGSRFVNVGAPVTVQAPTGPEAGYIAVAKALITALQ
jgi:hypothetical protein